MFSNQAVTKKFCLVFCMVSSSFFIPFGLSYAATHKEQKIEKIKMRGEFNVCSSSGFIPFDMKNNKGEWLGFDFFMMKAFAEHLGVQKLNMSDINFDGIIPALVAGKCDMIAAGMTVTEERKKVLLFSETVYLNGLSAAVKLTETNKTHYKTIEQLNNKSLKIAVKTGYTSDIYATKHLKNAHLMRFDQDPDLINAVIQGKADAFITDSSYLKPAVSEYKNKLYVIKEEIPGEPIAVAAHKNDKNLIEEFNRFFANWKKNGGYDKAFSSAFITQEWRNNVVHKK
ncbi:MAG: transporter substrate-binding domain-containing protein [Silvanigrellaceae bacterium]|nr:transporter substrate-binding domain-containing protein [Silvanigrellaceae bacterium]